MIASAMCRSALAGESFTRPTQPPTLSHVEQCLTDHDPMSETRERERGHTRSAPSEDATNNDHRRRHFALRSEPATHPSNG